MSKYLPNSIRLGVWCFLICVSVQNSTVAWAKPTADHLRCSDVLRSEAIWSIPKGVAIGILSAGFPGYGWALGATYLAELMIKNDVNQFYNRRKVAALLDAASFYRTHQMDYSTDSILTDQLTQAEKVLKSFYNKYILLKNPSTRTILPEIVERLHYLNTVGVQAGWCSRLITRESLANSHFPSGELSHFDKKVRAYEATQAKLIQSEEFRRNKMTTGQLTPLNAQLIAPVAGVPFEESKSDHEDRDLLLMHQ